MGKIHIFLFLMIGQSNIELNIFILIKDIKKKISENIHRDKQLFEPIKVLVTLDFKNSTILMFIKY